MRVLHVIPSVDPKKGGPTAAVLSMTKALLDAGVQAEIATTHRTAEAPSVGSQQIKIHSFHAITTIYEYSPKLSRWLREHVSEYDVIHTHALFSYAPIRAARTAATQGIPYIVRPLGVLNRWGLNNRRSLAKRLSLFMVERKLLETAATVQFTSREEELEVAALNFKIKPAVIPLFVSDERPENVERGYLRALYPQVTGNRIVLFLSRIDPKKGLPSLLTAFALLNRKDTYLAIAGTGDNSLVRELTNMAERLGIADRVLWLGFVTGTVKWRVFADADVFVLPSLSENFGVSVIEAMQAGVPVIVSDQVALHTQLQESRAGEVVRCDPSHIAFALKRILSDEALRATMTANARLLLQDEFAKDVIVNRLIDLYSHLVE